MNEIYLVGILGALALVLLVTQCFRLLDQRAKLRAELAATKANLTEANERLDAVALPGTAECWRLEAGRAQTAATLAQKLADDRQREIADMHEVHRQDAGKIVRLAIEIERLERRELCAKTFPRINGYAN